VRKAIPPHVLKYYLICEKKEKNQKRRRGKHCITVASPQPVLEYCLILKKSDMPASLQSSKYKDAYLIRKMEKKKGKIRR